MSLLYVTPEEAKQFTNLQKEAEATLNLHGRHAPPYLEGETYARYERRLTDEVKQTSPKWRDVRVDAGQDTFPIVKQQIFEDSQREARHPTDVPEGTLKEVITQDQSGRPVYSYYGKPSVWMKDFMPPRKFVERILDTRQWHAV